MLLPPPETNSAASGDATIAANTPITNAASTFESVLIQVTSFRYKEISSIIGAQR